MNYLAHLFLTRENPQWTFGNFVADFSNLSEQSAYDSQYYEGILLHRKIDSFTDSHSLVKEGTKLLHHNFGKYAPVVIDIFFDYFLHRNFDVFSPSKTIQDFCDDVYRSLMMHVSIMPLHLQHVFPKMVKSNWLKNYGSYDGIRFTFTKLQARVSFRINFGNADQVLRENEEKLDKIFLQFFPELQKELSVYKAELISRR